MEKFLLVFGILSLPTAMGHNSFVVKKSDSEVYNHKETIDKLTLHYKGQPKLELLIDVKNFSQPHIVANEKKKQRRERIRKRKDKGGKSYRPKGKLHKPTDYAEKHVLRNNEKVNLVRNKTIEILKNGLRILSAGENYIGNGSRSASLVNATLLEKILSSAVSKQGVLLSATGEYKLPIGIGIYETKGSHGNLVPVTRATDTTEDVGARRQNKKQKISEGDRSKEYDYDYDLLADFKSNTTTGSNKPYETFSDVDYESINLDYNVGTLLEQIVNALKNLTNCSNGSCSGDGRKDLEDPCERWMNCRENLDRAFRGNGDNLPSCPCTYPSSIFYDETLWDKKHKKYFRWRDASSEAERLDIYKPGAAYCIRSLLTQGTLSVSSQQCCYDRRLRLLTRGSGAGTVNLISPDISKKLHYTVDVLPWRLCKGDFTRYNLARNPNNGNNCPDNPDENLYHLQMKLSKVF